MSVISGQKSVRRLHHDAGERPMITIWEVTRACALVCQHCRADAQHHRNPKELSTVQGKALLDDIAGFGKPFPIVVMTGGDPFEREDLEELVAYGHAQGLHMALSPSVTPRMTPQRLKALRDAGASAMSLSLDGCTAQTHDAFRGVPGVYDATVTAAGWVKEAGFRLQINSTVTRKTVHELPDLLRQVIDLGAALWSVFFLVPTGRGQSLDALTPQEIEDVLQWLHDVSDLVAIKTTEAPHYRRVVIQRATHNYEQYGDLYSWLTEHTAELRDERNELGALRTPRPPIEINSGRGFAFIDHVGDVYPSGFLPQQCGNVKEESFKDIYRTSPTLKSLRQPDTFDGKCGVCGFNALCGGSRSHSYAVTGNLLASDPTCVYQP
ncbi:TIGR04053 family radical SAM/SPASM domain-containing protein [Timonella sp. A28]|uniref:TIGR04053 family radical SAM/SPASM domain-containing protein n=1 Tax=Timonella sp. A28 TaxID=3442640 RepID=UPI003EC103CB